METNEPIELPTAAVTPEELQWLDYQAKEKLETLKRYEEVAKYLSGLSTISLTILTAPNSDAFKRLSHLPSLKIGILCWLLSIIGTLLVLFPFRYKYTRYSSASISQQFNKTARNKYRLLVLSTLFFLTGICITVCLYLFY